MCGTIKMIADQ